MRLYEWENHLKMGIFHRHVWLPDGQRQGTLSPSLAETPPGNRGNMGRNIFGRPKMGEKPPYMAITCKGKYGYSSLFSNRAVWAVSAFLPHPMLDNHLKILVSQSVRSDDFWMAHKSHVEFRLASRSQQHGFTSLLKSWNDSKLSMALGKRKKFWFGGVSPFI